MIMKANKQIGFIYKNEESIDKILKDGDVVFERGFLREKTSTTLPITFGGVGKDLKDYRVYGNTVQKILPDEYTQVEYIKNTGLQYIDTGVYGNLNTEIRVKASSNGNSAQLFGDITTTNSAISCNFSFGGAVGSRFGNKSVSAILGNYVTTDVAFELIENKNGIYIDNNELIVFDTTDNFTTTKTLFLLNRNSSSGANDNRGFGKLYYAKIYDNNVLVRDFIPCYRNSDNEVGLYDLVNKVFYTNQGTGSFTYGSVAPTPDTPIEIVSCGDRTKNLFDISTVTSVDNGSISDNLITSSSFTSSSVQNVRPRFSTPFPYKTGTYYISADVRLKSGTGNLNKINDGFTDYTKVNFPNLTNEFQRYVVSHKYNSDTSYSDGRLLFQVASNSNELVLEIKNIMISTSNDYNYTPYGYKIPVNVRSDNLFDKGNLNVLNAYIGGSSGTITSSSGDKTFFIPIKSNTTYTIKKIIDETKNRFRIGFTDNLPDIGMVCNPYSLNQDGQSTYTLTSGVSSKYLVLYYFVTGGTLTEQQILDSIMIVEGSTAPSKYIPYYSETTNIYLDEPLRKIDEYSDYIDFKNGRVVRNIDEIILNGSESWATAVTRNNYNKVARQFLLENAILNQGNSSNITKSTHFGIESANNIYSNSSIGVNCIGISDSGYLRIGLDLTVFPGDNSFKTWLSENNVTVDYVLETSTEEPITLPNIPTIDENNTLNIETEITPSQVYIKYKSNN